jgi:predicted nucleotidyltransferase
MRAEDVQYENKYLNLLRQIIFRIFRPYPCKIFLFGSRAEGIFQRGSDYDIGITGLDEKLFSRLKNILLDETDESLIPYRVDMVNFDKVPEDFRNQALKKAVIWKEN